MAQNNSILPLGTKTQWGKIVMIRWVGERYYWMIDKYGVISMMPADMMEATERMRK